MLITKWGKALDKNHPLCEYPRPQFVRDSYISLNGMWKCAFYNKPDCEDEKFRYDICVPFSPEAYLSGVHRTLEPGEYLIYKRNFVIPKGFNKGRVFINFGAVDQIATVFINGNNVATHKGGYTSFKFEITDYVTDGENEIMPVGRVSTRSSAVSMPLAASALRRTGPKPLISASVRMMFLSWGAR